MTVGLRPGTIRREMGVPDLAFLAGHLVLRLLERGLHAGHGGFPLGYLAGGLGQLLFEVRDLLAKFFLFLTAGTACR